MRRLALVALLALAGCAHIDGGDAAQLAAAGLGAAVGSFAAVMASPDPAPVAVVVEPEPDGGAVVDWPGADAGPCAAVADRVCCTPEAISRLVRRDGGP